MATINDNRVQVNFFSRWMGRVIYKLIGWKTEGEMPDVPRAVIIVAHHTSNWDFPIGLFASYILNIKGYWIGKHTLFKGIMGPLMRRLGGISVDRSRAFNLVDQVIAEFQQREHLILVITPEGTRKKTKKWKSGFHRIARGAGVPIVCAFVDYQRRRCGIGPTIMPGDDAEADMKKIREFYQDVVAFRPELVGPIKL